MILSVFLFVEEVGGGEFEEYRRVSTCFIKKVIAPPVSSTTKYFCCLSLAMELLFRPCFIPFGFFERRTDILVNFQDFEASNSLIHSVLLSYRITIV